MQDIILNNDVTEADLIEPAGTCSECLEDCWFSDESFDCYKNGKPAIQNVEGADSHCCGAAIIKDY